MSKFDPRWNTSSGKEKPANPYTKAENIGAVAKAMKGNERTQSGFRIGENQAKKINHDKPPQ